MRDDGSRKGFGVDPGPHLSHQLYANSGAKNDLPAEAMAAAPAVGGVYSAARINEWITILKSQYKKAASWATQLDHANADVGRRLALSYSNTRSCSFFFPQSAAA